LPGIAGAAFVGALTLALAGGGGACDALVVAATGDGS